MTVAVCTLSSLAAARMETPLYEAESAIRLSPPAVGSIFGPSSIEGRTPEAVVEAVRSSSVADAAQRDAKRPASVSAFAMPNTNVVRIRVRDPDPHRAAALANGFAEAYIDSEHRREMNRFLASERSLRDKIDEMQRQIDSLVEELSSAIEPRRLVLEANLGVRRNSLISEQAVFQQRLDQLQAEHSANSGNLELLSVAQPAASPISVVPIGYGTLGSAFGLLVGVLLVLAFERIDDTIRDYEDLERLTRLPVLGVIRAKKRRRRHPPRELTLLSSPDSPEAEAYRSLAVVIRQKTAGEDSRSVQITSVARPDGKSETLGNLAVATANLHSRTVVIDFDLRDPQLESLFGVASGHGVAEVVTGATPLAKAINPVDGAGRLLFLGAGSVPDRRGDMVSSVAAARLIETLSGTGAIVFIDSPPILAAADAMITSSQVAGVVIVATGGETTRRAMFHAVELLRQVDARLLGCVLRTYGN